MKRLILISLVLAVLLSLTGCTGAGSDTESGTAEPAPETTAVSLLDLSGYGIVYPLSASKTVTAQIKAFVSELETAYGVKLPYDSDIDLGGASVVNNDKPEILIGNTNRFESIEAEKELTSVYSYILRVSGNKVVILGGNEEMTLEALSVFLSQIKEAGSLAIAEGLSLAEDKTDSVVPPDSAARLIASEYSIIFPSASSMGERVLAKNFAKDLGAYVGASVNAESDKAPESAKELMIGATSRTLSADNGAGLGYYDYRISVKGDKIAIDAGSETALGWAIDSFLTSLKDQSADIKKDSESTVRFGAEGFNPIIYDISLFTPSWAGRYKTPEWLLDFDEKTYAITCGTDKRITFKAHRGDCENYPENSIEGIASAILAGVDAVEVDVHMTKDGVAVLMHDDTLTRTTNADEFVAKKDYPSSMKVSDWTYAQICSLRLRDGNKKLTEYKVPTLYEALILCSGKTFIQVDDKSGKLQTNTDLFKMASDTDSKECFFHHYGIATMRKWASLDTSDADFAAYVAKCESYLATKGHAVRGVFWPNDTNTYAGGLFETPDRWQRMISYGKMMIWTENVTKISEYVSQNYTASLPNN